MNQDARRSTSSYYRTLYSKYRVEDCYLQTRRQRRATGAFLERLEMKGVLADERVPKRHAKRLSRAFRGSEMIYQIATALTVAAMLTLLQSSPVSAAVEVEVERGVDGISQVDLSVYRGQLKNDDDSDGLSITQTNGVHKTSLHFVAQKAPYSPVTFPGKNGLLIDADSDMPQRYEQGSSLTVIDTSIEGWRTIKDAVIEGEVLLLEAGDPVDEILEKLQAMGEIESLSIISHGDSGALYFDGVRLSSKELEQQADKWRRVGSYLSRDGDIHLFGCHIAENEKGKAFVSQLAGLTGADVAASVDPTGDSEQGGDWVLEAVQGEVGDLRAMNPERLSLFKGVLLWTGTIDFSQVRDAGAYNGAASINASFYNNASNTYTLVGDALVSSSYSGAGYLAAPNASETQLTLSFLNSEVFDASSLYIYNCSGTGRTFRVSSNLGDTATTTLGDASGGGISLIGFSSSLTSLTITNDAGGVTGCFYVDNFAVVGLQGANSPPVLGGTFTTAGSVNDNATTSPFGSVTVTDADGDNVSVSITYAAANGTLSGTGLSGGAGSYTVNSAVPATATANLQGLVFTPTTNQAAAGSTVVSTFTLTPNDSTVNGTANATTQVTATSINDNPVITSNGGGASAATSINENTSTATTVTATDVDPSTTMTYSISGGADAAAFSIVSGSGALSFSSAPNFEAPTDADSNNVYDVQVTATDNGPGTLTDVQNLAVTVNNVNENPLITSDGGGASAALNAAENQTSVTTVSAFDSDTGDNLTYSISGGADAALFGIVGGSGVLTFNAAPDFETPTDAGANGVYDVQVTVTDDGAGNLTDIQDIAVTVTGGNDSPVITSNGGGATGNVSIDENTTAVTTVTATDPDVGDNLTYSISGGTDAAAFSIIAGSGVLSFNAIPSFETPADAGSNNVYDVQVTVTDDGLGNLTDVQDLAVTVNNINEDPTITSDGGGATAAINVSEGQTAVTTVIATDPDAGDTLTYSISGGLDAALFNINGGSGALSFLVAPVFSTPTDNGNDGTYDVQVTVTDDGVGNLTDLQDIAVSVTDVNSPPGGTLTVSGSATEDQMLTAVNSLTDADGLGTMSYQWNRDGIPINGATGTTYTLGDDDIGFAISVTVSYTDGGGTLESVTSNATTAVENLNDSPTGAVMINGEAAQGQTLTADASSLVDSDGLGVFSFHWQSGSTQLTESSGTYTLTANDVGNRISVSVSYRDGQGTQEQVTSDLTAVVTGVASDVPEVVAPADITLDATGLFTEIDLGTATATDPEDGDLMPTVTQIVSNGAAPEVVTDTPQFFSPGVHLLSWTVTDADDNSGLDTQTVNVIPLASFSKDQISTEGETASFKVILNGPAVNYPVTVPYTLSGTVLHDGSDHSLSDGQVTISHPSLEAAVSVSFVDDGANEGSETLVLSMATPDNAVIGPVSVHQIEVREGNVAPTVELIADQNGAITRLVSQTDGSVIVTALVTDPNRGDDHSYDWSSSDNRLVDTDADSGTFTFDPSGLASGVYRLELAVSDSVEGGMAELMLNIVPALPELAEEDSDDDGIDDTTEGAGDSDGDGIPDYLDHAETAGNVIQEQQAAASEFLMETEPGLLFLLGDIAFRAHGHSTSVTTEDIENHGDDGAGAEPDDAERYSYQGGLFDFSIESLPVAGQSVSVVLPQFVPVPADAVYRKLMSTGWQDFVIDDQNRVASALGSEGYCPPPGDASYTDGLTEGDWCVQLTIQDGGPNDADQTVDTSIDDPGGVAQRLSDSSEDSKSGGGGSTLLFPFALLGLAMWRRYLIKVRK